MLEGSRPGHQVAALTAHCLDFTPKAALAEAAEVSVAFLFDPVLSEDSVMPG